MDFNPAIRNEQNFRLPPRKSGILAKIKSFLSPNPYIRGVDLSHWNGDVDFVALKASGIDFVILKASEGISFVDDKFDGYWRAAHEAGLLIMTYHFFRSNYGGADQAKHHLNVIAEFLQTVGYKHPVIWADVETSDSATVSQRRNRLLAFHQTITSNGFQSGHYSSPYLWNTFIGDVTWADDYWGWDAHWTSADEPVLPVGWNWSMLKVWQYGIYPTYSWVDPVDGVPSAVDCNWFYGTLEDMEIWLGVNEPVPPPVDCCDELRAEIARLEAEINTNKLEIYHLQQQGADQEARLSDVEYLIQSVKDVLCK
jgi:GH25 family lysozyme M1 (1,4-beta-N-acetylmuramidase)